MTTQPALLLDLTQRDTKTISLKQIFALQNVAYGSLADVRRCFSDVRFAPNSGHSADELKCPLSAKSGQMRACLDCSLCAGNSIHK